MLVSSPAPIGTQPVVTSIEISIKGKWVRVPAMQVNRETIVFRGGWLKMAAIHDEEWMAIEIENPESYVEALKERGAHGLRADLFTFTQKVPGEFPKYSYRMEWTSVAAIRISSFKDWWEKLPQETRKNVRRSQKRGVTIQVKPFDDALIRGISDVNNDSPVRQGLPNTYYGKTLDQVKNDYCAFVDRSDFICAYSGEEMVGFLKVVYKGEVASIINLTTKGSHSDKRPANALVARAVEVCEAKKVAFITYGQFNYGNKQHSPLREFKIRNGFEEILKPRYYVPLTVWGSLCMKAGFHRGLLGILPPRAITLAVNTRTKWYDVKRSMSRCSSTLERPNSDRQMERSIPPAGSNS